MMFVFGCAYGSEEQAQKHMRPGIEHSAPDSLVIYAGRPGENASIFPLYADILRQARGMMSRWDDVEGLVLLHNDLELTDDKFIDKCRKRFADHPNCAIIGAIGGRGLRGCEWWVSASRHGWAHDKVSGVINFGFPNGNEVDSVDGMLLILSPWAIENLRADCDTYFGFHAYDADLCFQARKLGKKVMIEKFSFMHHCKKEPSGGYESLKEQSNRFRSKWGITYNPMVSGGRMQRAPSAEERPPRFSPPRRGWPNNDE